MVDRITKEKFPRLKLSYRNIGKDQLIAQLIQYQWSKILGIHLHLEGIEAGTYTDCMKSRQLQIGLETWYSYYNDPIYHLEIFKDASFLWNWGEWENIEFQSQLQKADLAMDRKTRRKHLAEAEKILLREMPIIPLYYEDFKFIQNPHLKNLVISDLGEIDFKYCYLEEE